MADVRLDPPVPFASKGSQSGGWPAHAEAQRVRPAPGFLAEGTTRRKIHSGVPDADPIDPEAIAFRDNRPRLTKRWLPLVIPMIAVMLAVMAGSILLLET